MIYCTRCGRGITGQSFAVEGAPKFEVRFFSLPLDNRRAFHLACAEKVRDERVFEAEALEARRGEHTVLRYQRTAQRPGKVPSQEAD